MAVLFPVGLTYGDMDGASERVTLVGGEQVFDRKAAVSKGDDDLLGLSPIYPRIIGTLSHKTRQS